MPEKDVLDGVKRMRRKLPQNRLRRHLEKCALRYGCPAGKNFFLGRYEAPLPTATTCNAGCLGCLSLQDGREITCSQERIRFTPTPEEIAEIALVHIGRVSKSVVSFGQGCEGDPLMSAATIEPAIRLIRSQTRKGTINMNTNGSLPDVLRRLFVAGLDSIRISINSVRKSCYMAYFRPSGYRFEDVLKSIRLALKHNKHVALNYLNLPGITDTPQEVKALDAFLKRYPVHQIQWRNLNFDPMQYWEIMRCAAPQGRPIGVKNLLERFKTKFPEITNGYFNPPKENW
jgi:pyruvate-formate lyase-activating enzyme